MNATIALKCDCGSIEGFASEVSFKTTNHIICMCGDCQAFAYFLGRADTILDLHGGTEILQLTPSQIKINKGVEHLCCARLTSKGLMRWYAGCCKTPIANTGASAKIPFAGVFHHFIFEKNSSALGPVLARVNGRYPKGKTPPKDWVKFPVGLILKSLRLIFMAWVKGKHKPSPFFDATTGKPVVEPFILDTNTREELRKFVQI